MMANPSMSNNPTMTAAALKAKRWRENKKLADANFAKQEAERKKQERGIKKIVAENPDGPLLQLAVAPGDPPAPRGTLKIVTGEYDSQKSELVEGLNRKSEGRKVMPTGVGASSFEENDGVEEGTIHIQPPRSSNYASPSGRKLKGFVYSHVKANKAGEYECILCDAILGMVGALEIETEESVTLHYQQNHPKAWQTFLAGLNKKRKCREDHKGMAERKGRGSEPLHCGKCKVIIWRPAAVPSTSTSERSDAEISQIQAA